MSIKLYASMISVIYKLPLTAVCLLLMALRDAANRNVHVRRPEIFDCSRDMDTVKALVSVRCVMNP